MSGRTLRLRCPAKVNWSLEVLARRPDGYHDVRAVLQTLALSDTLTVTAAEGLSLELIGEAGGLAARPLEENLAYRAAARLERELSARGRPVRGARIVLEKRIPVAAGLGGGSSDAAAVLRGLRALWDAVLCDDALSALAAELGADVPFFLAGGTALASGRGERLTPLPDALPRRVVLAWPARERPVDKTARMYACLRAEHFDDGSRTERLAALLRERVPLADEDLSNVFERVLPAADPEAARAFERAGALEHGRPHLAGSGPAFFCLVAAGAQSDALLRGLQALGLRAVETETLPAGQATAIDAAR